MDLSLAVLLAIAGSIALAAFLKDPVLPLRGLQASGRLFGSVWMELLVGFLIAGLVDVLMTPDDIAGWLGGESSMRGICVGWAAGLVIPGGPYLLFPIAAGLLKSGAAPGAVIALISAKTLVSPIRMLTYEAPLLGWPITLVRCLPALFLPPILGLIGQWAFTLFVKR